MKLFFEIILLLFIITVVHEGGHCLALKAIHVPIRRIQIWYINICDIDFKSFRLVFGLLPLGGFTTYDVAIFEKVKKYKKVFVLFGGIFANLIVAAISLWIYIYNMDLLFFYDLFLINLMKAALNIIPLPGTDGMRIVITLFYKNNGTNSNSTKGALD